MVSLFFSFDKMEELYFFKLQASLITFLLEIWIKSNDIVIAWMLSGLDGEIQIVGS